MSTYEHPPEPANDNDKEGEEGLRPIGNIAPPIVAVLVLCAGLAALLGAKL